jgi:hypothetical protein
MTRNAYKSFIRKHEGKRPFGRPWQRWKDNMKMDLTEIMCERAGFKWCRIWFNGRLS